MAANGFTSDEEEYHVRQVADVIHQMIAPLVNDFPSGLMSGRNVHISPEGRAYESDAIMPPMPAISINTSNLDPSMLNTKRGLSPDCGNKLCYFYEYALSCKAIGFNMSKICAQYFMGRILGCPAFPSPSDFYNAPSVCLTQLINVAKLMKSGTALSQQGPLLSPLLNGNFTHTCHRNCYQNFLNAGISFYKTCYNEINASHPISLVLENFNTFRQQVCGA